MAHKALTGKYRTYLYDPCPGVYHKLGSYADIPQACPDCGEYFARCCQHDQCHQHPAVFVDGACFGNGSPNARSGYSVAYGSDEDQIISVPIDESQDPGKRRTNQRAELLAACLGVEALKIRHSARQRRVAVAREEENDHKRFYVVATDSDYVVKGITEWMAKWEKRRWLNSAGKTPTNLDLFLRLLHSVEVCKKNWNMEVKFVWIPREDNLVADEAAKLAAKKAVPVYLEHLQARRDEFEEAPVAKRLRTVGRNTCESYGIPYHDC